MSLLCHIIGTAAQQYITSAGMYYAYRIPVARTIQLWKKNNSQGKAGQRHSLALHYSGIK